MWALTICQLLHFPIGVACRRLMGGQADALYLGGALISALVWAVLGSEVGVGAAEILSHGYMAHVLPLPLATLAMLVGSAEGGGGQPWGPALATVASIGLSFVIFEPKLHGTDEYDWLSDNVYAAFSFILLSYSIGHYIADHSQALTAAWARCKVPKGECCSRGFPGGTGGAGGANARVLRLVRRPRNPAVQLLADVCDVLGGGHR